MSQHRATVVWSRSPDQAFTVERFDRDHHIRMGTGLVFAASSAPEYRGNGKLTNPEELLVAAISSCHMLTFLTICAKKGLVVDHYEDEAVGVLERPEGAPTQVTRCTLRPRVTFHGNAPDPTALAALHEQAHRGCFIANSVRTIVEIELT